MQPSIILCLSQAMINWEGCSGKGIRHKKIGGKMEVGHWSDSLDGVASRRIVGVAVFVTADKKNGIHIDVILHRGV